MNDVTSSALLDNQLLTVENKTPDYNKDVCPTYLEAAVECQNSEPAIRCLLNELPDLDDWFHIHEKIGEGTFSNVYLASLKGFKGDKRFAIKHLIPTCHAKRIQYELDCLNLIGGKDNVISCEMSMRQSHSVVFIMPYLEHQKFGDYVLKMTLEEGRLYMKNLFLALRRVHSFKIIHRDIKPSNFLYNRDSKQFLLIDFGLAQKMIEHGENSRHPQIPKTTVTKRKREDDDVENVEKPMAKRCALQTLSNDIINKQTARPLASLRYSKQPLSIQQQKCQQVQSNIFQTFGSARSAGGNKLLENMLKRQPLTVNSTNVVNNSPQKSSNHKQTFQSLMPQKILSVDSKASFVRVKNSQIQPGSLFPKPTAPVRPTEQCVCRGKPHMCNVCLTRRPQYAPRAGTPGFRPPEVLLKYPNQTTAVDMWSSGVIMLSILSGCYPFFRSPDDITALCELITVFGSAAILNVAKKLRRNVICNENRKPLNLWLLCENLRRHRHDGSKPDPHHPICADCHHSSSPETGCLCESKSKLDLSKSIFPSSAFDLLSKLLDVDPDSRISAELALQHPFITGEK